MKKILLSFLFFMFFTQMAFSKEKPLKWRDTDIFWIKQEPQKVKIIEEIKDQKEKNFIEKDLKWREIKA